MKHVLRVLNIALIVFLLSLAVAHTAFAQGTDSQDVLAPFAPILAAAVSIERLLQLIRNTVSPNPESGLLARNSPALRYYTTFGGVVLGLVVVFIGDIRLLALTGVTLPPIIDTLLTGVVIGLGTEFVHEIISVVGEGKRALRASSKR